MKNTQNLQNQDQYLLHANSIFMNLGLLLRQENSRSSHKETPNINRWWRCKMLWFELPTTMWSGLPTKIYDYQSYNPLSKKWQENSSKFIHLCWTLHLSFMMVILLALDHNTSLDHCIQLKVHKFFARPLWDNISTCPLSPNGTQA
jgi:hypothetical protein